MTVLDGGTYLARMNLAGQKGAHPGGVLVRVIEYRVDGGEVIRLLTDLTTPRPSPLVSFPPSTISAGKVILHRQPKTSSAARRRFCGPRTRSWCARRHGRVSRCTTA